MALTVIIALVTAFVLSLTFMPAMIAIFVTGKVNERDNASVRGLKGAVPAYSFSRHSQAHASCRSWNLASCWRRIIVRASRAGVYPEAR